MFSHFECSIERSARQREDIRSFMRDEEPHESDVMTVFRRRRSSTCPPLCRVPAACACSHGEAGTGQQEAVGILDTSRSRFTQPEHKQDRNYGTCAIIDHAAPRNPMANLGHPTRPVH